MNSDSIPYILATASMSGSPHFPILVLDDAAAIAISAIAPLAARLGHGLTGSDTVHGLLQDWDRNRTGLSATVQALDDAGLGKYTRSFVTAVEFFDLAAPLSGARQVMLAEEEVSLLPSSALAGPRAKVPVPQGAHSVHGGLALGVTIGAPCYRASADEAASAIAGLSVVTRYATETGASWAPGFVPIGPYLVPPQFCDEELSGRIAFNGETGFDGIATQNDAAQAVCRASAHCQLFPGDLVIVPMGEIRATPLGDGDIIETAIIGLGQQITNIMVESRHAHSGN